MGLNTYRILNKEIFWVGGGGTSNLEQGKVSCCFNQRINISSPLQWQEFYDHLKNYSVLEKDCASRSKEVNLNSMEIYLYAFAIHCNLSA